MADESKYPTRIAPYGLRMEPELKARIQQSADANARSLHAEIIHALEDAYPAPVQPTAELLNFVRNIRSLLTVDDRILPETIVELSDELNSISDLLINGQLDDAEVYRAVDDIVNRYLQTDEPNPPD